MAFYEVNIYEKVFVQDDGIQIHISSYAEVDEVYLLL
jgi:hypothetical protein